MKANIVWSIVLIAVLLVAMLPPWANAQDGGSADAPDAGDTLAPYRDWLWGILDTGLRVTGGTECATDADGVQRCQFDVTLRWAETE